MTLDNKSLISIVIKNDNKPKRIITNDSFHSLIVKELRKQYPVTDIKTTPYDFETVISNEKEDILIIGDSSIVSIDSDIHVLSKKHNVKVVTSVEYVKDYFNNMGIHADMLNLLDIGIDQWLT